MITPDDILGAASQRIRDTGYESFQTPLPNVADVRGAKDVLKTIKDTTPDVYRHFFPKVYCQTDKFHDWRMPRLISMLAHLAAETNREAIEQYQAYVNLISFALQWAEYKTPTFFVGPELLKAVQASGLPKEFDFTELKLPFPSMVFVFPKGSRPLTLAGKEVQYVGLSQMKSSISTPLGEVHAKNAVDKLIVTTAFYPKSFIACGFQGSAMNEIVAMDTDTYVEQSHDPRNGVRGDKNEAVFTQKLLLLALGCLLAMEARPDLLEPERRISVTHKKNEVRSLWSPNILGRKYSIRRTGEAPSGSHASPRSHWRRGHFRRQGVGHRLTACRTCGHEANAHYHEPVAAFDPPLPIEHCELAECACEFYAAPAPYSEYKTIWIEPMLIAGKATATG